MIDRRRLLWLAPGALLAGCAGRPTGGMGADCSPSPENSAGPFYRAGAPERSDLITAGVTGTPVVLTGRILAPDCEPVTGAILDVWHADPDGVYDQDGYLLRGVLSSDDGGEYRLRTVMPGNYADAGQMRPAHIHVVVSAPGYRSLTTQIYFPGDPHIDGDPLFHPDLLAALESGGDELAAELDLTLDPA